MVFLTFSNVYPYRYCAKSSFNNISFMMGPDFRRVFLSHASARFEIGALALRQRTAAIG
jgi:hypothetical protein